MRRTAVTRLEVGDDQRDLLEATIDDCRRGCQLATEMTWPHTTPKNKVQRLAYDAVRERTDLSSQHTILATHQAAEAITGCHEYDRQGRRTSKPEFNSPTGYQRNGDDDAVRQRHVSLRTVAGRVRCALVLAQDDDGYQLAVPRRRPVGGHASTLTPREDTYSLHIGFRRHPTGVEREVLTDQPAEHGRCSGWTSA